SVRRRAECYYQQLDALRVLRLGVRRDLLVESKKQKAWKRLCEIPSLGPIRAAVLLGILQTPHRFRTKRQLWTYGGLAIEMHSSADHPSIDGQLQRSRKKVLVRGLKPNSNHELKKLFNNLRTCLRVRPPWLPAAGPPRTVLRGLSCQRHAARDGAADLG